MNQVHEANKIIESGCDDFAEFLKKSAGLGLHPDDLKDMWDEYWYDVHCDKEETLVMDTQDRGKDAFSHEIFADNEESRAVEQHYVI